MMDQPAAAEEPIDQQEGGRKVIPPYIPFGTLVNLLRRMKSGGAPDVVDRSYLTGMSGGYQSQVIAALKAFGLIEDDGRPSTELELLLKAEEDEWPVLLRERGAVLYAAPLAIAERNATQGQLERVFREEFGFTGSTLRKAIKFYLDVSSYVGLPVSPYWKAPSRSPRAVGRIPQKPVTRGKSRVASGQRKARSKADHQVDVSAGSRTQTLELASGGKIILEVDVDLFTISENDRQFVFDLVDRVRAYRQTSQRHE